MVLVRNIAKNAGVFNLASYAADWRAYWENPSTTSYKDGASKTTHANLQEGKTIEEAGSASGDFSPVGRAAALFSAKWESHEDLVDAARKLTALTHNNPQVIEATEFFARVVIEGLTKGTGVVDALKSVAALKQWSSLPVASVIEKATATASSSQTDNEIITAFGSACPLEKCFPSTIHILIRYPTDPVQGMLKSAMAGGETAARNMVLGMVYGMLSSCDEILWPQSWVQDLKVANELS